MRSVLPWKSVKASFSFPPPIPASSRFIFIFIWGTPSRSRPRRRAPPRRAREEGRTATEPAGERSAHTEGPNFTGPGEGVPLTTLRLRPEGFHFHLATGPLRFPTSRGTNRQEGLPPTVGATTYPVTTLSFRSPIAGADIRTSFLKSSPLPVQPTEFLFTDRGQALTDVFPTGSTHFRGPATRSFCRATNGVLTCASPLGLTVVDRRQHR